MAKASVKTVQKNAPALPADNAAERSYTLSVIVDNEPGILARVAGLFSGRGYNIETLTVSSINAENTVSRITIVTIGSLRTVQQIEAQLGRLVPVRLVENLTTRGAVVAQELVLVKLVAEGHARREALRIADIFGARVSDTTLESFIFSLRGDSGKLSSFIELLRALGEVELARSGTVALGRGASVQQF